MNTEKKDIDLLGQLLTYAEQFATDAIAALGAAGVERIRGVLLVCVSLKPFIAGLVCNLDTLAERDGDSALDKLIAPLVEKGLAMLASEAQAVVATRMHYGGGLTVIVPLGQERPSVRVILNAPGLPPWELFALTVDTPQELVH